MTGLVREFTKGLWDEIRAEIRDGVPEVQHFAPYTPSHYMNTPPGSAGVAVDEDDPSRDISRPGQELRLYFVIVNDGDGRKSVLRVDEVSLTACGPLSGDSVASPTPTPAATATASPTPPPTVPSSTPSVNIWRTARNRPAPRAARMAGAV